MQLWDNFGFLFIAFLVLVAYWLDCIPCFLFCKVGFNSLYFLENSELRSQNVEGHKDPFSGCFEAKQSVFFLSLVSLLGVSSLYIGK